jgi:uncharacterized DUF497 family protein
MQFEFDPGKSEKNRLKHGIDFLTAQNLWQDESRLIVPARSEGESREAIIARLGEAYWTGIYTVRAEKIRLISVRRSRDEEKQNYNQGQRVGPPL